MTYSQRTWITSIIIIVIAAAGLGWWVYNTIQVKVASTTTLIQRKPENPFSSKVISSLKERTIFGDLPVKAPEPATKEDPFIR